MFMNRKFGQTAAINSNPFNSNNNQNISNFYQYNSRDDQKNNNINNTDQNNYPNLIYDTNQDYIIEICVSIGDLFNGVLRHSLEDDPMLSALRFCEENRLAPSAAAYIKKAIDSAIDSIGDSYEKNEFEQQQFHSVQPLRPFTATEITSANNNQQHTTQLYSPLRNTQKKLSSTTLTPGVRLYQSGISKTAAKRAKAESEKKMKDQAAISQATFKPKISAKSTAIIEGKESAQRRVELKAKKQQRFFQVIDEQMSREFSECTFQPTIGVESERIGQQINAQRNEAGNDVFDHLFYDSQRRQQLMNDIITFQQSIHNPETPQKVNNRKVNQWSEEFFVSPDVNEELISEPESGIIGKPLLRNRDNLLQEGPRFNTPPLNEAIARETEIARQLQMQQQAYSSTQQQVQKFQMHLNSNQHPPRRMCYVNSVSNSLQETLQYSTEVLPTVAGVTSAAQFESTAQKRANNKYVWEDLYSQAVDQREFRSTVQQRVVSEIATLANTKKMSKLSENLLENRQKHFIQCVFECLDGNQSGVLSKNNLNVNRLSEPVRNLHLPLINVIRNSEETLDRNDFGEFASKFYDSLDVKNKLVLSQILSSNNKERKKEKNSMSVEEGHVMDLKCAISPKKSRICSICSDTMRFIDLLAVKSIGSCPNNLSNTWASTNPQN